MNRVKVALVGCGRIAIEVHLPALLRMSDVDVVALVEPDNQRRAQALALAGKVATFREDCELDAFPGLDAVVICSPNAFHSTSATRAFLQHKHVYLEKPIATSLHEADSVLCAWRQAGTVGMIGFNYRFHPFYVRARAHILAGDLGEIVAVRSVFSSADQSAPEWKTRRATGGGVLLDLAMHHVDLCRFLLEQEIVEVYADLWSRLSEHDTAALRMRLSGDCAVQSFFNLHGNNDDDRLEVYGTAARMNIDRRNGFNLELVKREHSDGWPSRLQRSLRRVIKSPVLSDRLLANGREPSYHAALAHFIKSIRSGNIAAAPNLNDGYAALSVIATAERSAALGQAVQVARPVYAHTAH